MRHRPLRVATASAIALALSAVACIASSEDGSNHRPSDTRTTTSPGRGAAFTGHGVSFSYPKAWRELPLSDSSASTGTVVWTETVGIGGRNLISVSAYTLDVPITEANVDARAARIGSEIESLFTQAGGSLTDGPTAARLAALPALSFTGTARTPDGRRVDTRLTLAFDGTTEYALNCQNDDRRREAIDAGCDRVASTFTVTG